MATPKSVTNKTTLVKIDSPKQVADFAKELADFVNKNKLYAVIGEGKEMKKFVQVEGWQFAGASMGFFFVPTTIENVSPESGEVEFERKKKDGTKFKVKNPIFKYKATVEMIRVSDGQVVGRGIALCSNQEWKKKTFDEYAVLSMAQTRAIGKAGRNTLGWVMKLAGYEPTPAEEMDEPITYEPIEEETQPEISEEPNIDEMRSLVSEHLNALPSHEKMRLLKTVGKLNDKDLTDSHIKRLWYTIKAQGDEQEA